MVNEEILQKLKDIHVPGPSSIWPLALGYYLVLLIIIALVVGLIYYWRGRPRRRLKKAIILEFSLIEKEYREKRDNAYLQASITALLKRMVLSKSSHADKRPSDLEHMADEIKQFLAQPSQVDEILRLVLTGRFQKNPPLDGDLLLKLMREQIRKCRI